MLKQSYRAMLCVCSWCVEAWIWDADDLERDGVRRGCDIGVLVGKVKELLLLPCGWQEGRKLRVGIPALVSKFFLTERKVLPTLYWICIYGQGLINAWTCKGWWVKNTDGSLFWNSNLENLRPRLQPNTGVLGRHVELLCLHLSWVSGSICCMSGWNLPRIYMNGKRGPDCC